MIKDNDICRLRHSHLDWVIGIIFTIIALTVTASTYAIKTVMESSSRLEAAETCIETHKAASEKETKYIIKTLDEVRDDVKEIKEKI